MTEPDIAPRLTLPNSLSASRLLFAGVFAFAFVADSDHSTWMLVAFGAAALAMVSDWADGYLARRMGTSSDFGKLFDPLADAIFFVVAFGVLALTDVIWIGLALPFLIRELTQHLYIRPTALRRGVALGAKWIGKIKTGVQAGAVLAICLVEWALSQAMLSKPDAYLVNSCLAGLAGALSIASIVPYMRALAALGKENPSKTPSAE
ncbi:MAG: CDP-alcohol phosphatidyltransferase family protein [Planctomycetes bacterium]|nr:CDP-alcohol phosphatidyltransferase family protein [Planctomycetota bacterium]